MPKQLYINGDLNITNSCKVGDELLDGGGNHAARGAIFSKGGWSYEGSQFQGKNFIPSKTMDLTTFANFREELGLPSTARWSSGVLSRNGYIYMLPLTSSPLTSRFVLKIDPGLDKIVGVFQTIQAQQESVIYNNKIYGSIVSGIMFVFNVLTETEESIDLRGQMTNPLDFETTGTVLGYDNKIYFIPRNRNPAVSEQAVLVIYDPTSNTITEKSDSSLEIDFGFSSGVMDTQGVINMLPYSGQYIVQYNIASETFTSVNIINPIQADGGVLLPNSNIYIEPRANGFFNWDPINKIVSSIALPGETGSFRCGALGFDNKVYNVALETNKSSNCVIYDYITNTFEKFEFSSTIVGTRYRGSVVARNGKIYVVPINETVIPIIKTELPVANNPFLILSPEYNNGG